MRMWTMTSDRTLPWRLKVDWRCSKVAGSSYYYGQYNSYKKEASRYDKNIKALIKIRDSLTSDFYDEQSNVNKELSDLKDDLKKSVRHDPKFSVIASECESYKEKSTTADANLNCAVIALENEIATLNQKKSVAEQNRDAQYRSYTTAKQEERQAWLDSLKNIL